MADRTEGTDLPPFEAEFARAWDTPGHTRYQCSGPDDRTQPRRDTIMTVTQSMQPASPAARRFGGGLLQLTSKRHR